MEPTGNATRETAEQYIKHVREWGFCIIEGGKSSPGPAPRSPLPAPRRYASRSPLPAPRSHSSVRCPLAVALT